MRSHWAHNVKGIFDSILSGIVQKSGFFGETLMFSILKIARKQWHWIYNSEAPASKKT